MENSKRSMAPVYVIIGTVFVGVMLSCIEYVGKSGGLELRTFMQVIKGLWLWMVVPLSVTFAGGILLKPFMDKRNKGLRWLRIVLMTLAVLGILIVGFLRGILYIFTSEMVTEKINEEGYIVGTYSDFLSATQRKVYESAYGIFRKPFEGWSETELTEKLREKYGDDVALVKKKNDDYYMFSVPDIHADGEFIYFHAKSDYYITNDFVYRVIQNQAMYFWSERDRTAGFYINGQFCALDGDENVYKDIRPGIYETADFTDYIDGEVSLSKLIANYKLYVYCSNSDKDIAACAGDIADWYAFLGKCPYIYNDDGNVSSDFYGSVKEIVVGTTEAYFNFYVRDAVSLDAVLSGSDWSTNQEEIKNTLSEKYKNYLERKAETEQLLGQNSDQGSGGQQNEDDEFKAPKLSDYDAYIDNYVENYEVECVPGDGQLIYRFVVLDAALGSRMYGIIKSEDGGESWRMWSNMPFGEDCGGGIDAVFLDENLGFATLSHNGGDEADLYVTVDGGVSYTKAVLEGYTVTLDNGYTYTPYDFPKMPYEEDGAIYVLCGQGADGDYDGGDRKLARYKSEDGGYTFSLVDFVNGYK